LRRQRAACETAGKSHRYSTFPGPWRRERLVAVQKLAEIDREVAITSTVPVISTASPLRGHSGWRARVRNGTPQAEPAPHFVKSISRSSCGPTELRDACGHAFLGCVSSRVQNRYCGMYPMLRISSHGAHCDSPPHPRLRTSQHAARILDGDLS
jgi:hypothetical protein